MLQNGISGLLVLDEKGRLAGILTEGDFLRRTETGTERHRARWIEFVLGPGRLATDYIRTHGRKVEDIMTRDVATVGEDATLTDVVSLMEKRRIGSSSAAASAVSRALLPGKVDLRQCVPRT